MTNKKIEGKAIRIAEAYEGQVEDAGYHDTDRVMSCTGCGIVAGFNKLVIDDLDSYGPRYAVGYLAGLIMRSNHGKT